MNEVELKYSCKNHSLVKKKALALGFISKGDRLQKDTYFLVDKTFEDGTNIYLRLREEKGKFSLDYHVTISDIEGEETEVNVEEGNKIIKIFTGLQYPVLCVVEKHREKLIKEDMLITLDTVTGLGSFVEIETEGKTVEVEPVLRALAKKLNLPDSDLVQYPYVKMILKKNS